MKASDVIEMAYKHEMYLKPHGKGHYYLCNLINVMACTKTITEGEAGYAVMRIQQKIKPEFTLTAYLGLENQGDTEHFKVKAHEFWAAFVEELRNEEAKHS